MFNNKKSISPKKESLEINITDFSKGLNFNKDENILKTNYSVNSYNFIYKKGVLTDGYGFETLKCPNYKNDNLTEIMFAPDVNLPLNFLMVWFFKVYDKSLGGRVDKLLYYCEDKGLYYNRIITIGPAIFQVYDQTLDEKPTFNYNIKINGVDYNLFGSENMGVYKYDGDNGPEILTNCPSISSLCEDKGKLFATGIDEKNYILYHVGTDITQWTSEVDDFSGKIVMNDDRGKINKLIPFLGYLFAIRDYGISKIYHQENRTKFDITHLSLQGNKIYENTVRICGDKMIMLTKEGITTFNGVTTKVLDLGINELLFNVANDNAVAVFHSGKYYLSCRVNFKDNEKVMCEDVSGYKNNAIIVLDTETNEYDIIRGVDVISMESIKLNKMDKIVMIMNNLERTKVIEFNDSGCFYNTIMKKEWVSPLSDLGYSDKIKFIRSISLLSKYDCKITVFTEKESKEYNVLGSNTLNRLRVNLKGKQIGLKVESFTAKAYISNIKLKVDLLDYGFTKC